MSRTYKLQLPKEGFIDVDKTLDEWHRRIMIKDFINSLFAKNKFNIWLWYHRDTIINALKQEELSYKVI